MLDRSILGTSWDSVMCKEYPEGCSAASSARSSPLKDASNFGEERQFCVSRHNPNRTYRRESVIASWRSVRREREQALGKRYVYVDAENHVDYYGRNKVKRCRSERATEAPKVQRRVKRAYSVLHRYDPNAERVVKEYKYLQQPPEEAAAAAGAGEAEESTAPSKSASEPFLARAPPHRPDKKVKRSLTALLNIKTKLLNIFSSKS